jgi:hypothetical protein
VIVRRVTANDPVTREVAAMIDGAFGFYGGPFWDWKYGDPDGPQPVIMITEADGDVIGCSHYLKVPYQLGGGREMLGLAGGDLFVKPEARRRHVATELSLESRKIVTATEPEATFVVMFTWDALGAHYEKLLGYTRLDVSQRQWSKRLDWGPQSERLAEASPRLVTKYPGLARAHHGLRLEVGGAPPLDVVVGPDGFRAGPISGLPVIRIRAKGPETLSIRESGLPAVWAVAAVIGRRFQVSGSRRAIREALSVAGAYARVLRILRRTW